MSKFYYSYRNVNILCPRDPGFTRLVSVLYHLPYTADDLSKYKKLYVYATCKLDGKTETCTRCLNSVVNMLNNDDTFSPESPLSPDLAKY